MPPETRNCQNCKASFTIEPEDFDFYKKIEVPPPTWCPECRLMRRLAFMNIWSLYKHDCAKCGKNVMSMYSPDKTFPVYCMPCWNADDWDGTEYAMDYDPSRPFLEQVIALANRTPWATLEAQYTTITNSEYTNGVAHVKNCYLIFWADYCENAFYSSYLNGLKDSMDCYRMEGCELCYGDVGCNKCYRTFFSEECESCTDVWFSRACVGCTDCFGCVNLRNKSYYIFNEKYSKEEYFEKLKSLQLDSRAALEGIQNRVREFWDKHPRRAYDGNTQNVNVTGDYIYQSKNTRDAYMVTGVEDSRYIQFISVASSKNCYDYTGWGNGAELVYESVVTGEGVSRIKFSFECWPNSFDLEYCAYVIASKHCFGCVNLKRKEYCILNKQYSKEEYERLVAVIRKDIVEHPYRDAIGRVWRYGESLPLEICRFAYNEGLALPFFPKTREEALAQGFRWHEKEPARHPITKKGSEVPDTIGETDDSVLKENVGCLKCGSAFRFVPGELALMRRFNLPLPGVCPNCRQDARLARTNLPRFYDRNCAKCGKAIHTSYAPDRPEIVYCEQCYQAEVA